MEGFTPKAQSWGRRTGPLEQDTVPHHWFSASDEELPREGGVPIFLGQTKLEQLQPGVCCEAHFGFLCVCCSDFAGNMASAGYLFFIYQKQWGSHFQESNLNFLSLPLEKECNLISPSSSEL